MANDAHLEALDRAGDGGSLSRAVENLSRFLVKSEKARFVPDENPKNGGKAKFVPTENPQNATRTLEPAVAKRGKAVSSMGGNPEAQRVVPDDENMGGEDELDNEPEAGAEGRIKRARNKAKAKVPASPAGDSFKSWQVRKGGPPLPDTGDDDEDDGPADDEDADDESGMPPTGGEAPVDPKLAAVLQMLEQNPQLLVAAIEQIIGGGAAAGGGMGPGADDGSGMPPGAMPPAFGAGPGGPPPPAGPPPPSLPPHHGGPAFARSLAQYQDSLTKAFSMDPRADQLADAIDASVPLEMLTSQMVEGFSRSLATLDALGQRLEKIEKSFQSRLGKVEQQLDAIGELNVELGKSLAEQQDLTKSVARQPVNFPHPGVMNLGGQPRPQDASRDVPLHKSLLSATILDAMRKSENPEEIQELQAALVNADSSDWGAQMALQSVPEPIFQAYRAKLPA